jgi:hypothetical protein
VGGPKSPYNAQLRAFARLRGKPVPVNLHTDWEDAADYAFYALRFNWTPQQVDALPYWLRARYRAFAAEWGRYMRGE